jgi:hypothetical protein
LVRTEPSWTKYVAIRRMDMVNAEVMSNEYLIAFAVRIVSYIDLTV